MSNKPPAPASYDAVPQGYGAILARSPNGFDWIGTDGLTTCLGIYVVLHLGQDENYFIAHFDCEVRVQRNTNYQQVVDKTAQMLAGLLGNYNSDTHDRVLAVSPFADLSTLAMFDGLKKWMGNQNPERFPSNGFRVKYDGGPPVNVLRKDKPIAIKVSGDPNCRLS